MPAVTENNIRQQTAQRQRCMVACAGYRLKCLRLKLRLSVSRVSADTGLHKKAIERIETGGHFFTLRTLEALAHYYRTTHGQLLDNTPTAPTMREWKMLKQWQRQLSSFFKSKDRKPPACGVQLELGL